MKGISPLVATVLLIAFVVSVAGILSIWLNSLTVSTTQLVGTEASVAITCSYGGIKLSDLSFSNDFLTGGIENTGSITLGDISLQIVYLNLTTEKIPLCLEGGIARNCSSSTLTLSPRDLVYFNISASSNFDKIRVLTNCTSVYFEAQRSDVSQ
ncbi:MAG: archaellin/type IV pilin N-terminal domain-containing protein [Candidatus Aenigmatarchaeota archaeon]